MRHPAIEVLEATRNEYESWMARLDKAADPAAISPESIRKLSAMVQKAGEALEQRPQENGAGEEWHTTVGAYSESLARLHKKLEHLGISLRVRRMQLSGARVHQQAVRSWAELTQNLR
ncbi:MAG TPA: hypothetical protein VMU61_09575 [Candidatus Aquilonibacter sp.]|nr:hypothetical protein [Candidatus Aquilonibacter sp.]